MCIRDSIDALRMILDAASLDAASYDALVDWMSASVLPVALQFLTEGIMLAVPLACLLYTSSVNVRVSFCAA